MMNKFFYLINSNKERENARIISQFNYNGNDYVTYTLNELNDEGMVKIYVSGIENNSREREIVSDDEWTDIKNVLKLLAKSINEPVPESIKTNLDIEGKEIEIDRPKKLLVSKQFTEVLENKDTSKAKSENTLPSFELPKVEIPEIKETVINTPVSAEPEPELEKTIKIPTFEELQARNKNIQAVRETAMENVTPEVTVEPELPKEPEPVVPVTPTPEVKRETRTNSDDYKEKFSKEVEPVLLDIYAEKQKRIEELEEELSKTKFDLFEKQKEALSLSHEKEEYAQKNQKLEEELTGVQAKMNGILDVLQGNDNK